MNWPGEIPGESRVSGFPGRAAAGRRPWLDVDGSEALLAEHLSAAIHRFGSAVLGLVDLPPIETARPSRADLGVAGVLLWARHVEETGLLDFVAALATGVSSGMLPLPLTGPVVRRLIEWRRGRAERFSAEERAALYERVFHGGVEGMLHSFVVLLTEIGRAGRHQSIRHLQVRAAQTGLELASSLSASATGIAAFAARDIVGQVRDALAILTDPELALALGSGPPWTLIARHAPRLLDRPVDPARAVQRALAGRTLIEWLARNADALVRGTASPNADDEVVHAALAYAVDG